MEQQSLTPLLPIDAALSGKDESGRNEFLQKFAKLPLNVRRFMSSTETARSIDSLVKSGSVPQTHGIAVAKLMAFLALGEVTPEQLPALLEKIGVPDSARVVKEIEAGILRMLSDARKSPQPTPKPIPPLTVRRPAVGPLPRPPAIIDLRKQQS